MRVLFNLPSIPQYQARFRMLTSLARKLDSLTVLTNEGCPPEVRIPNNVSIICLPKDKPSYLMGLLTSSKIGSADIIHDTFGYLLPLGVLTKLHPNKKYISSVYGSAPGWLRRAREIGCDDTDEIRIHKQLQVREHLNSLMCDYILVNSTDFVRDYTEEFGYPHDQMEFIPNSVIIDENAEYIERDDGPFNILYIGRLAMMKGIHLLLQAHQDLLSEGHEAHLTVVGRPLPFDRKIIASRTWKSVNFIDEKPFSELVSLFRNADVYVHPSFQEGMPRVIMEALSYGTPVIASDLPGIRAIDDSGTHIKLLMKLETSSIKESLAQEMGAPRRSREFFESARCRMRNFSPDNTASKIFSIYEKLL
jgi:glycosyltransferase involved in cell wall biosynthesis